MAETATSGPVAAEMRAIREGLEFARSTVMLIDAPYNDLTREILSAAIEVHRVLGPGLFESVYTPCFHYELGARNLRFETQRIIPVVYKGQHFGARYRVDLIVEGVVVVEMKAVAALLPVRSTQVLTT